MHGGRGRRGRGRGRDRWNRSGSGSEGAGRWSPRSPLFHPQPQPPPPPPPPPPSVRDDVCGSGSNEEGRRKTCSEDDTSTPGSGSVGGSAYANKNNMKTHDGDGDGDAMMIPPPQCTTPAHDNNIQNHKDENSSALVALTDDDSSSFDICRPTQQAQAATTVVLKPPLLVTNRERRNQIKRTQSPPLILRPGMLLFKAHISLSDQVKIVQRCRELGKGSGGFYQPGYGEGTKLHLKMMCLGKHWDPQCGQYYDDRRPCDGAKPPHIPPEFLQLVRKAIADSHALLTQAQDPHTHKKMILPHMSPDICIVNFYSHSGRLGLHQDKDESPQSLRQGLPVVSFSIGDSADFLYGDDRDVDKAHKLLLESGDVLIFGGDSRNIFHGVSAIHQMTAPSLLLQQTSLRPGRLNLTFRQY